MRDTLNLVDSEDAWEVAHAPESTWQKRIHPIYIRASPSTASSLELPPSTTCLSSCQGI
ncbi:hypothetical protein K443DRAFT_674548, partial [Laccaria amethystina LaAM-08-1]